MTVPVLMQQIEETERLIAVYRDANEVIIGTQDEVYSRRGLINRTTLSAAEIGDQIVRILERRLAAMRWTSQRERLPDCSGRCWPASRAAGKRRHSPRSASCSIAPATP